MFKQVIKYITKAKWADIKSDIKEYNQLRNAALGLRQETTRLRADLIVNMNDGWDLRIMSGCIKMREMPSGVETQRPEVAVPVFLYCPYFNSALDNFPCPKTECQYYDKHTQFVDKMAAYNDACDKRDAFWKQRLQSVNTK